MNRNQSNFRFAYSRSVHPYDRNKDEKKTSHLTFSEKQGSIDEFISDIKMGYAFTATFNYSGKTFPMSVKRESNFKATNTIVFDLDAVKYSIHEFWGKTVSTQYQPSIIYTTANDGHFKEGKDETYCNRYRVIYVTDEPITSVEQYKQLHQALKRDLADYVNDADNFFNDPSDNDAVHFFAGCVGTTCMNNGNVISLTEIAERYNVNVSGTNVCNTIDKDNDIIIDKASANGADETNTNDKTVKKLHDVVIRTKKEKYYTTSGPKMTNFQDFIHDYENTNDNFYRLSLNYTRILPRLPEESPIEFDKDKLYKEVAINHIRILRKRHKVVRRGVSGNEIEKWEYIKYHDGQRRREKLYLYLQLLKAITPSATYEELLWMGVNFIVEQVDNSEDFITKDDIAKTVNQVLQRDWTPSEKSLKKYGKKIACNKELAARLNIPKKYAGLAAVYEWRKDKKLEKYDTISQYYDASLTIKENVAKMHDAGIEVSEYYIKRYKREIGIVGDKKSSKADRIALYYDDSLTDAQNIEQLAANGIKVSDKTFRRWKSENGYTKKRNSQSEPIQATTSALNDLNDEVITTQEKVPYSANIGVFDSIDIEQLANDFLSHKNVPIDSGANTNENDEEIIRYDDGEEVVLPWD